MLTSMVSMPGFGAGPMSLTSQSRLLQEFSLPNVDAEEMVSAETADRGTLKKVSGGAQVGIEVVPWLHRH